MSKAHKINDCFSVYSYGEQIKVSYLKSRTEKTTSGGCKKQLDASSDSERLAESVSRTRATIFELATCNPFEWFVTLTLDSQKMDRNDLKNFRKTFSGLVRDRNKYRVLERKIEYLLIPEQHKDGSWHMHGLFKGLNEKDLVKNEHGYLDWPEYRKRFGFCSFSRIKSRVACSKYITKYVTKDVKKGTAIEFGGHCYFCSQGLKRRETLAKNCTANATVFEGLEPSFENDYVKTFWLSEQDGYTLLTNVYNLGLEPAPVKVDIASDVKTVRKYILKNWGNL